jgi:hypothetical protein
MTRIDDIIAQRNAAIKVLTRKMVDASKLQNSGAEGMVEVINALAHERAALRAQAYEAALDDPAMTEALAKLKAVTSEMNKVAKKMVSATTFIANADALIATANKVIPVLKGPPEEQTG